MRCERGQAGVEWVGLVLLTSLAMGALATAIPAVDGRSFGGFLAHRIACAVKGARCDGGHAAVAREYGESDAALLREHAPGLVYEPGERALPVDWRHCRRPRCARAPDDRDLDAHRTDSGHPATAFAHVVRRGGNTYLQYWLYYPDSNSSFAGSDKVWRHTPGLRRLRYPGYHPDDWEGYVVRLGRDGRAHVRTTSHGHWQWCKVRCSGRWGSPTGWTRVSRGSHAGHIPLTRLGRDGPGLEIAGRRRYEPFFRARLPGIDLRERTTTPEGLRLVPLRHRGRWRYRPLSKGIKPPWRKRATRDPETGES